MRVIGMFLLAQLFYSHLAEAQGENCIALYASNLMIDVCEEKVSIIEGSLRPLTEGYACVADKSGKLLWYSDGETVWNRAHEIMVNGEELAGDRSTSQGALAVQSATNEDIYYLFTLIEGNAIFSGLQYSVIDMSQGEGFGAVVTKNVLLKDRLEEIMIGIPHPCGGIWIIVRTRDSNTFNVLRIKDGIVLEEVASKIGTQKESIPVAGHLSYSPESGILANLTPGIRLEFFQFDNMTGKIENQISLPIDEIYDRVGIRGPEQRLDDLRSGAFSQSGFKFYTSINLKELRDIIGERSYNEIIQISLDSYDLNHVTRSIVSIDSMKGISDLHFNSNTDGSIFFTRIGDSGLHFIERPNESRGDCGLVKFKIRTPKSLKSYGYRALLVRENKKPFEDIDSSICQGDTIYIDTTMVHSSGIYLDDSNDCKTQRYNIEVLSKTPDTVHHTFNEGESFEWHDSVITEPGQYVYSSVSSSGCDHIEVLNLEIQGETLIFIPSSFSPNEDGVNDIFNIFSNSSVTVLNFKIINRWGGICYDEGGTVNWNGKKSEPGVYLYVGSFQNNITGETFRRTGSINLIK